MGMTMPSDIGRAKFIAELDDWAGDAYVYELTPPVIIDADWDEDLHGKAFRYVIVSASNVIHTGPETYIFPAEKTGDVFDVADWGELDGSFRGSLDHQQALENAGYEIVQ